ncbi:MAG: hypothetical protein HKO57_08270, partial [Akkermansiaceae bacterium]|nr:hypothetical protein [Akkermansiaceae bacterium]
EAPDGTSVAIITPLDTTSGSDNYEVRLDDASSNPLENGTDDISGTPYNRTAAPDFALSSFNGKRAQGVWTLRIWDRDISAPSDRVGDFNEATLFFDGTAIVPPAVEANRIKGIVFRDYDADGIQDVREPGVAGITVVARNAAGIILSSTTSGTDGSYLLSVSDGVHVRVEFLGLPAHLAPGPTAAGVGSSVQFVTAPAAQIDFATHNPAEHVGDANPMILVPCYENGLPAGNTNPAFVAIPYNAEGQPLAYGGAAANPRVDASVEELGAVWGVAYQPLQQRAFTSAFLKRHVGFADGPGYVYILDYATAGVPLAGSFDLDGVSPANGGAAIDLGTVDRSTVDAGNNYVLGDPASPNRDYDAFGKVGTMSYGDADLSEDGNTLFIVNLHQRALITVDVSGPSGSLPGTVNQYPLGGLTVDGGPQTFDGLAVNGVMRPWGLEFRDGVGYLGVVNDASTGTAADLRGYVFTFDPANPAAGLTQVLDFPINWSRENGHGAAAPGVGDWQPWGLGDWFTVNPQLANSDDNYMAPQPILSGLEVNERGDIVIGITDRFSHQNGRQNYRAILDDPGSPDGGNPNEVLWDTSSMGDIIHACWNGSAYVMEGSAGCPVNDHNRLTGDSGNTLRQDDGLAGTGEYYYQDHFMESNVNSDGYLSFVHGETATGALAHLPGTENVISTQYDPLLLPEFGRIVNAQGLVWYDTFNGPRTQAYQVVESSDTSPQTFAKSNGLGDLELISEVAPIEIGNRVWNDSNGNGVQDPGEAIYSGVTVTLHDMDAAGAQVGSATTDANGVYVFGGTSDANMTSGSVLPDRNYQLRITLTSGPLANRVPTLSNAGINDLHDSDAMLHAGSAVIAFTTGGAGENDHTLDFGFGPENGGLGNLVYHDANGNGTYDSGEGIGGVTVEVYELFTIPGTDPPYATAVTLPNGAYAVTGLPDSGSLPNGPYTVHIPASQFQAGGPLEGFRSLPLHGGDNQTDDDADENGIDNADPATNGITAADVSIVAGTEPNAAGGETGFDSTSDDGPRDADIDLTVDFAFYDTADVASVGNRVWVDTNGNGIQDGGEAGFDGLTVYLLDSTGTTVMWADTTSGGGFYSFTDLAPGDYVLDFAPPVGYALTTRDAGSDDALDSDPDPATDRVAISLAPNENNDTVDAGVYQPATIGNFVWTDANGDGVENDGAAGIDGITVNLWNGTETAQLATTTTAGGGLYSFGNLAPGSYVVEFVESGGYALTAMDAGGDDGVDSDADPADGRADAVTVVSGESVDTIDAGMYQLGSINGFVRADLNGDGTGDSALSGVTVFLDIDGSGGFNAGDVAATTNGSGFYSFGSLVPGSYDVGEIDLPNYRSVGDNDGGDLNLTANVVVTSGTATPNINFSDEELGAIAGTVRADTDNDDAGDTPLSGVTVFLDTNGNGSFDGGEPTTTTSGAGTYSFTGLIAGDYNVVQVDLANYQSVSDTDGGDANVTSPVSVTVGATTANIDFVDEELGAIAGTVRADTDNDDTGDTPLSGVTVFLDMDGSGTLNAGDVSTTTSGAGTYSFTGLAPGNYDVVQVDLANYQSVSDTDGGDANVTS